MRKETEARIVQKRPIFSWVPVRLQESKDVEVLSQKNIFLSDEPSYVRITQALAKRSLVQQDTFLHNDEMETSESTPSSTMDMAAAVFHLEMSTLKTRACQNMESANSPSACAGCGMPAAGAAAVARYRR